MTEGMNFLPDDRLLRALAEELKLPLLQIARQTELQNLTSKDLKSINYIADNAINMIDGFLLSASSARQQQLPLEPVSLSSVLADTAHKLQPLARLNSCEIDISLAGKYGPAMAHKKSLEAALMLIGRNLIEARHVENRPHRVVLGVHRSRNGLVAGVFDNQSGLSADMLKRGRALYGSARQAMPKVSATSGAGVFIADALFKAMETSIYIARHKNMTGLAATLHPSSQLRLI